MKTELLIIWIFFVVVFILPLGCAFVYYVKWNRANQRASRLLRLVLTPTQYHQFQQYAYVELPSSTYPNRIYYVLQDGGPVLVKEDHLVVMRLCLIPATISLPREDLVVLHTLMIQADEEVYLQKANKLKQ